MGSRKIGLMNYLQGRKRDTEHRPWTQQRKERIGQAERVALKHILPDENRSLFRRKPLYNTGSSTWGAL